VRERPLQMLIFGRWTHKPPEISSTSPPSLSTQHTFEAARKDFKQIVGVLVESEPLCFNFVNAYNGADAYDGGDIENSTERAFDKVRSIMS